MKAIREFQTILFDLDGTLIDHFNVLHRCYVHVMGVLGKPTPSYEAVKRAVGGTMERTMRKFVAEEEFQLAAKVFWEHFDRTFLDEIVVFPGVPELCEALFEQRKTLAVYTNKQGKASRAICEHIGLSSYLTAVFGSHDTPWRKPDVRFTRHVLETLGSAEDSTCLIGDSPYDIETAENAGIPCFCVTTGTHSATELREAGADAVFPGFAELGTELFGINAQPAKWTRSQ